MASSNNHDSTTKITDMDMDTLVHCATYLNLEDISNMAISCKFLNRLVYSDSIWQQLFRFTYFLNSILCYIFSDDNWNLILFFFFFLRERWPHIVSQTSGGVREAYLARFTALQQFKFVDPLVSNVYLEAKISDLLLTKDSIFSSQVPDK